MIQRLKYKHILFLFLFSTFIYTQEQAENTNSADFSENIIIEEAEPVAEITEPVAEITEPVAEIIEPVAEITEPVAEIIEPVAEITEPLAEITEPVQAENSSLAIISLVIISLLFLISLLMNYKLLTWRSKYKDQLISFPESLLDKFDDLNEKFNTFSLETKNEANSHRELHKKVADHVAQRYDDIFESFTALQKNLDLKDKEIERLKKGYDMHVLKKYISRLISIYDICFDIIGDPKVSEETKNEVNFVADSIFNLLEELGVKKISIEQGASTKSEIFGIPPANEWTTIETNEADKNFTVKETLKEGFYIDSEVKEILKHPKIVVLIMEKNNE